MDLIVNNSYTEVRNPDLAQLEAIEKVCSIVFPEFKWDYVQKKYIKKRMIKKRYFDRKASYFPSGLAPKILELLKNSKNAPNFLDKRCKPKNSPIPITYLNEKGIKMNPRWYQKRAFEEAFEVTRGIIYHPTRSGKTLIMGMIAGEVGYGVLILVNQKTLLKQIHNVMSRLFDLNIGIIGNGLWDPQPITVATVQTLINRLDTGECKKFLDSIRCILIDECLPSSAKILMADLSYKTLGELYLNYKNECIISYDKDINLCYGNNIINIVKKPKKQKIYKIKVACDENISYIIRCSGDHKILVNDHWVKAKHLKIGDNLTCIKTQDIP